MDTLETQGTQIIATIGPSSKTREIFFKMVEGGLDIVRFNFSWSTDEERLQELALIREAEKKFGKKIPIIADLPGPRIQLEGSHTYDKSEGGAVEPSDKLHIAFAVQNHFDYIAASFVGGAEDVESYRQAVKACSGTQRIIAKIERALAIEHLDEIIAAADAIMVARGDMGNEVPLEQIPFIQQQIIEKTICAGKPVITATQMLFSMTQNPVPERAEVTDVVNAIMEGTSAVMLSEESASGKYPVEAVTMMKKIAVESRHHPHRISCAYFGNESNSKQLQSGKLIIVRHQESEWNEKGLWTGSRDIHLTQTGFAESKEIGTLIKDIPIDYAFASMQVRSIETLSCVLDENCEYNVPTEHTSALNERSYGDYTGKNKWDMEKILGEKEFEKIRRGWDCPIPNGETLRMVYDRAVPFFIEKIVPRITQGNNVLVVSHGNAIRALMKYIENISDTDIAGVEMIFSSVLIYTIDASGRMIHKEIRSREPQK